MVFGPDLNDSIFERHQSLFVRKTENKWDKGFHEYLNTIYNIYMSIVHAFYLVRMCNVCECGLVWSNLSSE